MAIESVNVGPDLRKAKEKRYFLYSRGLFRVIVTVLLLGVTVGVLKIFSGKGALGKSQKYTFNTIILALTLLLGINMTVSPNEDT